MNINDHIKANLLVFLDGTEQTAILGALKEHNLLSSTQALPYHISAIISAGSELKITVENRMSKQESVITARSGGSESRRSTRRFVEMGYHRKILMEMIQDHAIGADMCIIGHKGKLLPRKNCSQ